ncbi:MAG: septum formation initiator family protein [Ruminococcus sp.]
MAYGAYSMNSRGYDLSLFETHGTAVPKPQPQKVKKKNTKNNIVELPKMSDDKSARRKHNVKGLLIGFAMSAVIVLLLGFLVSGQVRLAELNQQISVAETELSHRVSEYTQMQSKVVGTLSTSAIEEYARTELGMTKATNQQKEYISLSQGDKAEVFEEKNDTIFTVIGDFIGSLWS